MPGTVLGGKYRVEQVLGVGGMGAVVAAHHLQLDQKVAIKYLLPEVAQVPEVVERFSREARASAKIRGEHVARVIDVGQFEDGAPYIVMEYLVGHDLAKELTLHAPLKIEDVLRYVLQACEALAEAHAAKIVHRDLKPQNLFLSEQPGRSSVVKVLDFGISKVGTDAGAAALTRTSALIGTVYYMSPEQMNTPKAVDHRSDIWSLGVILYELLTGTLPFGGESAPEIIAAILMNQPVDVRKHRPDIPEGLAAVTHRCLRTKADERYASVASLAQALAPYAAPGDRQSVEIAARVLGERLDPVASSAIADTVALAKTLPRPATPLSSPPFPASQPLPASQPQPPSGPPQPSQPPGQSSAQAPITTAHALSRSGSHERPRSDTPLVAFGIIGIVLVGGAVFVMKSYLRPTEAPRVEVANAAATVSQSTVMPAVSVVSASQDALGRASALPQAEAAPAASASSVAKAPTPAPAAPPRAQPGPIRTARSAPTPSAPVPSAAPSAPTKDGKNPFDMGMK
jgi:serine/threonine-protein kinase